jgi:hypothetical protein
MVRAVYFSVLGSLARYHGKRMIYPNDLTTGVIYPQRRMIKLLNKAQDHEKGIQLYLP